MFVLKIGSQYRTAAGSLSSRQIDAQRFTASEVQAFERAQPIACLMLLFGPQARFVKLTPKGAVVAMYRIMGASRFGIEEIDTAETLHDARLLMAEYRLAFGAGWRIWHAKGLA